jgi:hypothetical protein
MTASRDYFDNCDCWDYCAFCNYLKCCYYCDYWSCVRRHALILVTFLWTNVLQLLWGLTILVISSVRPWELDGWLTSRRPVLLMRFSMVLRLDSENRSWEMMSDCLLVLGCFAHWIPNQMAILRFRIITIIVQIIAIIGNSWINWVRIDTVTATLMQSTWAWC